MITMMERYRIEHQTPPFVPNFKSLCKNKQNNTMHITNDIFLESGLNVVCTLFKE